ncbi:MAG: hypothetical protein ACWA6X_00625 [Bauldia sp.]
MNEPVQSPIKALEGSELASVVFVRDYVQFCFEGAVNHTLTAVTHPRVHERDQWLVWDDPGYRDALCRRIDATVRNASDLAEVALRLEFDDGASIEVSLRPDDHRAAEAALLDPEGGGWWAVW